MYTTQRQVDAALREFTDLLSAEAGRPVAVTLHRGNGSYKIANVLIVDGTNRWPEGTGGRTLTEAWRALRNMIAGIGLLSDIRENDRLRDERVTGRPSYCDGKPYAESTCPDKEDGSHM